MDRNRSDCLLSRMKSYSAVIVMPAFLPKTISEGLSRRSSHDPYKSQATGQVQPEMKFINEISQENYAQNLPKG